MMRRLVNMAIVAGSAFMIMGADCGGESDTENTLEDAGEDMEDAAEDAEESLEDTAEETGDAIEDATD